MGRALWGSERAQRDSSVVEHYGIVDSSVVEHYGIVGQRSGRALWDSGTAQW